MKKIELSPVAWGEVPGVAEKVQTSDTLLRMNTKHGGLVTLKVSYTPADGISRRVTGGPVLPGPYAVMWATPTIIDGSNAERALNVADGDVVEMDGQAWVIRDDKWLEYPHLDPVEA